MRLKSLGNVFVDIDQVMDVTIAATLEDESFQFATEVKSKSTPQIVRHAIRQAATYVGNPLVLVPYLSPASLEELEQAGVSGVDLCGNGLVNIPGRVFILRTGNKNLYPDSRTVSNPFRGKSAMVARALIGQRFRGQGKTTEPEFRSLGQLRSAIQESGTKISLSQVSKAVSAFEDEDLVGSRGRSIFLRDPEGLLQQLAAAWKPKIKQRFAARLRESMKALPKLERIDVSWCITGASSASHYTPFADGGPVQVAVSDLGRVEESLPLEEEPIANFADIELMETDEPGYFFQTTFEKGIRRASMLQTWIELANGDSRQKDAAREIYKSMLENLR